MPSITKDVVSPAFGDPTAGGQAALVKPRMANAPMVLALVAAGVLSLIFVWFFVSFLRNRAANTQKQQRGAGEEGLNPILGPTAEKQLLTWMRRGSRGPFAVAKQSGRMEGTSHVGTQPGYHQTTLASFARNSLIPNFTQMVSPPAHARQPPAPCPRYRTNDTGPRVPGLPHAMLAQQLNRPPWRFSLSGPRPGPSQPSMAPTMATCSTPGGGYRSRALVQGPPIPAPVLLRGAPVLARPKGATWDSSAAPTRPIVDSHIGRAVRFGEYGRA